MTSTFILKKIDYSLSTEIPSSLIGRIECITPQKIHAPNVTRGIIKLECTQAVCTRKSLDIL